MSQNETEHTPKADNSRFHGLPWAAGAVLILIAAVASGLWWSRSVTVQEVRFGGHHFVAEELLRSQVEIPLGVHPGSLDFRSVLDQAERIPWVREAEISVEPGGKLMVHIRERQPIAMLASGEQKRYVDAEGVSLPIRLGKVVDLPLLYGFTAGAGDTLQGGAFESVRDFLVEVRSRPVSDLTISEVAWTTTEGVVALTNEYGVKLIFGHEDFDTRLRNWEAFLGEIVRNRGIRSMRTVDMRFRGQIVTRET